MALPMSHLASATIVTLKAFGDFLIAYSVFLCAKASLMTADIQLLAGDHVRTLALALGMPEAQVHYIGICGHLCDHKLT